MVEAQAAAGKKGMGKMERLQNQVDEKVRADWEAE